MLDERVTKALRQAIETEYGETYANKAWSDILSIFADWRSTLVCPECTGSGKVGDLPDLLSCPDCDGLGFSAEALRLIEKHLIEATQASWCYEHHHGIEELIENERRLIEEIMGDFEAERANADDLLATLKYAERDFSEWLDEHDPNGTLREWP